MIISRYNLVYIYIYPPTPGLCQGRGGAWDHRSCGTWLSGFKTAVCPASKPSKPFRRLPRQQASKSTTLTATCPCHLFSRGFKTAVCPPSNAPNAPAGLQGNNSYSYMPLPAQGNNSYSYTTTLIQLYMPLPSVFQGVQDCRFPAFKCSKCFRRLPRQQASKSSQQLLQLHALAICFSGGSRLPFARLQMLQTPPQASKASPNPPAGLQGNNCLPLPPVFQGVQDCRLPAFKCSKRLRRPPRQQLLQLYSYSYTCPCHLFFSKATASKSTTLTATCPCHLFFGVLDCRLPAFKCSKRLRRPPRQQLLPAGLSKPSRRPPRQQLSALAICFSGGSRLPFARLQMLQTPPQASKATTLTAIQLQLYMPLPSVFQGVQDCRLPTFKCSKRLRLPAGLSKPSRRPPRQQLSALAICFSGGSRLPFARLQMLQTPPQASEATTLTAIAIYTCPCHLFFRGFKTAVCAFKCSKCFRRLPRQQASKSSQQLLQLHALAICFSGGSRLPFAHLQMLQTPPQASKATTLTAIQLQLYMPLPSVFQGVQDCRLPAFKRSQRSRRPPRQQLLQLHALAISRQQLLQLYMLCHLFFRGFKTAVCPPSNAPNASAGLQGNSLQVNNSYSYMPLPSVFQGVL